MRGIDESFVLYKFRTMKVAPGDSGVSGGYKEARISSLGYFLRAKRIDELPQLLNVLKGDISFVGPRPPLRQYVEARPDLYGCVLKSRPGITGLASAFYHKREGQLLARCASAEETNALYLNTCIPRKAAYDLIYQRNANVCFDIKIIFMTLFKVLK
jgi:lipopolysaccharide/colanic/teichoic acid biosynthesis glycosyltransferase